MSHEDLHSVCHFKLSKLLSNCTAGFPNSLLILIAIVCDKTLLN